MRTPARFPSGQAVGGTQFEPGTVLQDTYRIEALIASGGMGDVYRATHLRLHGVFAIKVLHRDLACEEGLLARFRTEAKIMTGLHHPHIVQVFDFNLTDDGIPYLVMELAEGTDLRNMTAHQRTWPAPEVSDIVSQIAGALGAAHAQGVVHRDLKPENVVLMRMEDGSICVKVVDFGVSKTRGVPRITVEPALIGTPEFMAPEQARGHSDQVDHRTDQFALGILAYFLLTGREPFRGASPVAVLYQIVHEEAASLRNYVRWPSRRTNAVIRRAMAKDPERRFPSIRAFAQALETAVVQDLGPRFSETGATPRPSLPERNEAVAPVARCRRSFGLGAAMLAVAAAWIVTVLVGVGAGRASVGSAGEPGRAERRLAEGAARLVARVKAGAPFALARFSGPTTGSDDVP